MKFTKQGSNYSDTVNMPPFFQSDSAYWIKRKINQKVTLTFVILIWTETLKYLKNYYFEIRSDPFINGESNHKSFLVRIEPLHTNLAKFLKSTKTFENNES